MSGRRPHPCGLTRVLAGDQGQAGQQCPGTQDVSLRHGPAALALSPLSGRATRSPQGTTLRGCGRYRMPGADPPSPGWIRGSTPASSPGGGQGGRGGLRLGSPGSRGPSGATGFQQPGTPKFLHSHGTSSFHRYPSTHGAPPAFMEPPQYPETPSQYPETPPQYPETPAAAGEPPRISTSLSSHCPLQSQTASIHWCPTQS